MRGRLGFAQFCIYGKFGWAHVSPFTDRQYTRLGWGNRLIDANLSEVIPWWIRMLGADAPRRLTCNFEAPALVCGDACGSGHLGVALFADRRVCGATRTHWSGWQACTLASWNRRHRRLPCHSMRRSPPAGTWCCAKKTLGRRALSFAVFHRTHTRLASRPFLGLLQRLPTSMSGWNSCDPN